MNFKEAPCVKECASCMRTTNGSALEEMKQRNLENSKTANRKNWMEIGDSNFIPKEPRALLVNDDGKVFTVNINDPNVEMFPLTNKYVTLDASEVSAADSDQACTDNSDYFGNYRPTGGKEKNVSKTPKPPRSLNKNGASKIDESTEPESISTSEQIGDTSSVEKSVEIAGRQPTSVPWSKERLMAYREILRRRKIRKVKSRRRVLTIKIRRMKRKLRRFGRKVKRILIDFLIIATIAVELLTRRILEFWPIQADYNNAFGVTRHHIMVSGSILAVGLLCRAFYRTSYNFTNLFGYVKALLGFTEPEPAPSQIERMLNYLQNLVHRYII